MTRVETVVRFSGAGTKVYIRKSGSQQGRKKEKRQFRLEDLSVFKRHCLFVVVPFTDRRPLLPRCSAKERRQSHRSASSNKCKIQEDKVSKDRWIRKLPQRQSERTTATEYPAKTAPVNNSSSCAGDTGHDHFRFFFSNRETRSAAVRSLFPNASLERIHPRFNNPKRKTTSRNNAPRNDASTTIARYFFCSTISTP